MRVFLRKLPFMTGIRRVARFGFEARMLIGFVLVVITLSYYHFSKNGSSGEPSTVAQKIVYTNCMVKKANDLLEDGLSDEALILYNRALLFGFYNDPKIFEPAIKFYVRQPSHSWVNLILEHFILKGHLGLVLNDPVSQKRYDELLRERKLNNHLLKSEPSRNVPEKSELKQAEQWLEQQMTNREFYERHFAKPDLSEDFLVRKPQVGIILSEKF